MLAFAAQAQDCPTSETIGLHIGDAQLAVAKAKMDERGVKEAEDQLAAYTIFKWDLWGRASIGTSYGEVKQIADCHTEARCGFSATYILVGEKLEGMLVDGSWRTSSYQDVIPTDPPLTAINWAKETIGCEVPKPGELADQMSDLIFGTSD